MIGRKTALQKCVYPNSQNMCICYLTQQRVLAGAFKLRILRWGDFPELSAWAQCSHKGPYK